MAVTEFVIQMCWSVVLIGMGVSITTLGLRLLWSCIEIR